MKLMSTSRRVGVALTLGLTTAALAAPALAATVAVPMALATPAGPGASVGQVTLSDGAKGVTMTLDLHGLPPGQHGFHLHANPSCDPATGPDGKVTPAGAAGAHLDPMMTKMHMGPDGAGHLGDLPRIDVGADGTSHQTLAVTRLKTVAEFQGHALMIHAGGDTYADVPPLGGGGARLACGVVK
jgi:Cu-Zn family superoxide dismutase